MLLSRLQPVGMCFAAPARLTKLKVLAQRGQATELAAFLAAALAGLAASMYLLVLHLLQQKNFYERCLIRRRSWRRSWRPRWRAWRRACTCWCCTSSCARRRCRPARPTSASAPKRTTCCSCCAPLASRLITGTRKLQSTAALSGQRIHDKHCALLLLSIVPMRMQRRAMLNPPSPSTAPVPHTGMHAVQPAELAGLAPRQDGGHGGTVQRPRAHRRAGVRQGAQRAPAARRRLARCCAPQPGLVLLLTA